MATVGPSPRFSPHSLLHELVYSCLQLAQVFWPWPNSCSSSSCPWCQLQVELQKWAWVDIHDQKAYSFPSQRASSSLNHSSHLHVACQHLLVVVSLDSTHSCAQPRIADNSHTCPRDTFWHHAQYCHNSYRLTPLLNRSLSTLRSRHTCPRDVDFHLLQ